jgi:PKD repeat protein
VANPSVVYNQPGSYSVSLTLSNPNGNSDLVVQHYIKVQSAQTADANSLSEDFENLALLGADWSAFGAGDYLDFEIDKTVGYQSSSCLKLDNFSATKGQIDELYSPSLDVRFTTALNLRFRYAFATKESSDNDALRLYVSKDCGQTWVLTRIINTSSLITAGLKTAPFTPSSDADWKEYSVNLSSYAGGNEPIQIKWEMNSGGGNNLYIDQINMDASMSTPQQLFGPSLKLYPNPTSGTLYFESSEPIGHTPAVHLTDMSGRTMVLEAIQSEGQWAVRLPLDLSNGLYQLQIVSEEIHHSASFQLQR